MANNPLATPIPQDITLDQANAGPPAPALSNLNLPPEKGPATLPVEHQEVVTARIGSENFDDGLGLRGAAEDLLRKKAAEEEAARKKEAEPKEPEKKEEAPKEEKTEPEPKAEEKKEEAKPEEETVPDDELRPLPTDKPRTRKRILTLAHRADELATKLEEAEKKLSEKESKGGDTTKLEEELAKVKADLEKNSEQLLQYKRHFDLEQDPEFKKKYDDAVVEAEHAISGKLKDLGVPEFVLKDIETAKGFTRFIKSDKTYVVPVTDPNTGEVNKRTVTAAEMVRTWFNQMDPADAAFINAKLMDQVNKQDERNRAITEAKGQAKDYFQKQQESQRLQQERLAKIKKETTEKYSKWVEDTTSKADWLKDKPVPANATPEEKKAVEDWNEFNHQIKQLMQASGDFKERKGETPEQYADRAFKEYTDLVLDAAEAHHLRRENGMIQKEFESTKAELAKIKEGMRTTKGSSIASRTTATETAKKADLRNVDTAASLENLANARARGENPEKEE